jgi:hypothetical protein
MGKQLNVAFAVITEPLEVRKLMVMDESVQTAKFD